MDRIAERIAQGTGSLFVFIFNLLFVILRQDKRGFTYACQPTTGFLSR